MTNEARHPHIRSSDSRNALLRGTLALAVAVLLLPFAVRAQSSSCADCHYANPAAPGHLLDWERSAHGRLAVGCEKCHGGDPKSYEAFRAHQGILSSRNPASPVHRANLPGTCGPCHPGPYTEFQKSRHYEALRAGDANVPTCSTCHGEVGAFLLSPKGLEKQCARCHGPGSAHADSDRPAEGRQLLAGVREVRESLDRAKHLLKHVKDKARRERLQAAYDQAETPLIEAGHAGHAFVFTALRERLDTARRRTEVLLDELSNPTP